MLSTTTGQIRILYELSRLSSAKPNLDALPAVAADGYSPTQGTPSGIRIDKLQLLPVMPLIVPAPLPVIRHHKAA